MKSHLEVHAVHNRHRAKESLEQPHLDDHLRADRHELDSYHLPRLVRCKKLEFFSLHQLLEDAPRINHFFHRD